MVNRFVQKTLWKKSDIRGRAAFWGTSEAREKLMKKNALTKNSWDLNRRNTVHTISDWEVLFKMSLKPTTHNTPPIFVLTAWTYYDLVLGVSWHILDGIMTPHTPSDITLAFCSHHHCHYQCTTPRKQLLQSANLPPITSFAPMHVIIVLRISSYSSVLVVLSLFLHFASA